MSCRWHYWYIALKQVSQKFTGILEKSEIVWLSLSEKLFYSKKQTSFSIERGKKTTKKNTIHV